MSFFPRAPYMIQNGGESKGRIQKMCIRDRVCSGPLSAYRREVLVDNLEKYE